MPDPKVVISEMGPPVVVCRDGQERAICDEILTILRRGGEPVAVLLRLPSGEIEVHARSGQFHSIQEAMDIMQAATVKLGHRLFQRKLRARA